MWEVGRATEGRETGEGRLVVDTLGTRGTLGRRVRVSEVGTQAEVSTVWPGELVARMMRGSKTGVVGECEGGPRWRAAA